MFEHSSVLTTVTVHPHEAMRREQLQALRQKIRALQSPLLDQPTYPSIAPLEPLLPGGGLRRGVSYQIGPSHSLLWLLVAEASARGHHVAVVGVPHLGFDSATQLGVDLERLVLITNPGQHWWSATAALIDAVSLLVLSPAGPLPPASQRDRLLARMRERGSTLLVRGHWPGAEGLIDVHGLSWRGLGHGHGVFTEQVLDLSYRARRDGENRFVSVSISGHGIHPLAHAALSTLRPRRVPVVDETLERYAG